MWGQGGEVFVERGRQDVGVGIADPGDQRRFLDDPSAALVFLGEPGQRPIAGAAPGSPGRPFDLRAQRLV